MYTNMYEMQTSVKTENIQKESSEPKGIRLDSTIIDEIEEIMIEDDRPSFNNAVIRLLKEAIKARKSKQKEAVESQ